MPDERTMKKQEAIRRRELDDEVERLAWEDVRAGVYEARHNGQRWVTPLERARAYHHVMKHLEAIPDGLAPTR